MRKTTVSVGPTPAREACAQTAITRSWLLLQDLEARVYRAALIGIHGPLPKGVSMPVTTHAHDFGSYADLTVSFDADDVDARRYAAAIETGLSTWLDANFSAPVIYDAGSQPRPGSVRQEQDCIIGALVTCRRLIADGYATDREHRIVANLTAAFPGCATLADALLHETAGTA